MSAVNRKEDENDRKKDSSQPPEGSQSARRPEKRIVIETLSTAEMPKALLPESGPQLRAWSHLDQLYRISKLLAALENVNQTVAEMLAVITHTLPLRSAVLIQKTEGHADDPLDAICVHMVLWHAEGVVDRQIRAAQEHAMTSYQYLAGAASASVAELDQSLEESVLERKSRKEKKNFIVIPLIANRSIFGALQLEGPTPFSEADLIFLNAAGNQLAVALDRHYARQRERRARVQIEASEARMRFLAEASRLLAASLNYLDTWESMARLAVHHLADVCILDVFEEDQLIRRIPVVSPHLSIEISEEQLQGALRSIVSNVMRRNSPAIYPESAESSPGFSGGRRDICSEGDDFCKSYMCVPLRVNERPLGTLTVISMHPDRVYSRTDLALLQDLAGRAVSAFENARLYGTALQAVRSRDDLLSIVSHDLRAPLSVIVGYTKMFLGTARSGKLISCDAGHLEAVQRSATRMERLIEDLLSTASIEAKHVLIQRQWCEVVPLVTDKLELMQPLAMMKGIELKSEIPADIPQVFVDPGRITQVFANLLDNAIKFSQAGETITVRAEQLENEIQFSVQDFGSGIPEDQLPHIFDRFWKAPGIVRRGTGLGLFIVKGIVEAHAGRVWAESQVGEGSTFFFTLPINPTNEN
jgi:signal transduction histidine kinase